MHKSVVLVSFLVLGWTRTLQGLPVLPDPLYPTQENFDLSKTGVCKERIGYYELTSTPGRFLYHIAKWGANVDAYVLHTNYIEYAIMIMIKQKSMDDKSISLKLYSRTRTVRTTILDDFKTLVQQQGMSEELLFIRKDRGDCVPGEQVATPTIQPEPQRVRRNAAPSLAPEEVEGSGDDTTLFSGAKACNATPDTGPCFGMHDRYFYNSSSMRCELFKYGGCLGNQNNFKTERECLQRCRTEAVCRLPMAAQPCTGQPVIWAFDPSTGLCMAYKPGFCQSNANKFYTKSECEEYCGVLKDDDLLVSS